MVSIGQPRERHQHSKPHPRNQRFLHDFRWACNHPRPTNDRPTTVRTVPSVPTSVHKTSASTSNDARTVNP